MTTCPNNQGNLNTNNRQKAFTMIEILVVISIIGLLATMLLVRFSSVEKTGRDTVRRRSDINQYRVALENYAARNNGSYPTCPSPLNGAILVAHEYLSTTLTNGIPHTSLSSVMSQFPKDPRDDNSRLVDSYFYRYQCNLSATRYLLYAFFEDGKYFYVCSNGASGEVTSQPAINNECGVNPAS